MKILAALDRVQCEGPEFQSTVMRMVRCRDGLESEQGNHRLGGLNWAICISVLFFF